MANKSNFTPEEWTKVLKSPVVVGIAVSAADPSGLWGTLKEAVASSSAVVASKLDPGSNELVKAVVADFETPQGRSDIQHALRKHFTGAHPTDCVQRSLDTLRQVSAAFVSAMPRRRPSPTSPRRLARLLRHHLKIRASGRFLKGLRLR